LFSLLPGKKEGVSLSPPPPATIIPRMFGTHLHLKNYSERRTNRRNVVGSYNMDANGEVNVSHENTTVVLRSYECI